VEWGPCHRSPSSTFPPTCHSFEAKPLPPTRCISHLHADVDPQTRQQPRRSGNGPRSLLRPARNLDEDAFEDQLHLSHLSTSQSQALWFMCLVFTVYSQHVTQHLSVVRAGSRRPYTNYPTRASGACQASCPVPEILLYAASQDEQHQIFTPFQKSDCRWAQCHLPPVVSNGVSVLSSIGVP
jgi:hypothetical protein